MAKMTNKRWAAMSTADKYHFLNDGAMTIESKMGIRADAKVGGDNCDTVHGYIVSVSGVTLSEFKTTRADALAQAEYSIKCWCDAAFDDDGGDNA